LFLGNHFNYSSKALSIAMKVIVQQIVFTPVFNTYFFGMQALLSGDDMRGVIRRIRGTVPESIVNSLKLWPAVTAFTFTFIRPQYRFLFSGGFATLWQTYLSYLNRREEVKATRVVVVGSGIHQLS
jgi:protein Mpv17